MAHIGQRICIGIIGKYAALQLFGYVRLALFKQFLSLCS